MEWGLIALGAGIGSLLRYEIGRRTVAGKHGLNVRGTLFVNLTGAFALGLLVSFDLGGLWWNLLGEGFLGGFTTFSTLMVESLALMKGQDKTNASLYLGLSIVFGIAGYFLGLLTGETTLIL